MIRELAVSHWLPRLISEKNQHSWIANQPQWPSPQQRQSPTRATMQISIGPICSMLMDGLTLPCTQLIVGSTERARVHHNAWLDTVVRVTLACADTLILCQCDLHVVTTTELTIYHVTNAGIVLKQLNIESQKQCHTIAQGHSFLLLGLGEIRMGSGHPMGVPIAGGVGIGTNLVGPKLPLMKFGTEMQLDCVNHIWQ